MAEWKQQIREDEVSLIEKIAESKELLQWIDNKIYGLEYEVDAEQSKVALACFYLTFTHCSATLLLIEHELYPSANVFQRIIIEAYIRGSWLFHCASDEELEKFKEKGEPEKGLKGLIGELEERLQIEDRVGSETMENRLLHDFVHTGYHQIEKQFSGNDIKQTYTEDEKGELLDLANCFAITSAHSIAKIAGNAELTDEISAIIHSQSRSG